MIRLYGTSIGNGSFARVTAGVRHGLSELGRLAGFVPVDNYDSEEIYEGHDAPTAVYIGDPSRVDIMTNVGWHEKRWALLPANSTWMPEKLIRQMEEHVSGFLAPSPWAQGILRDYTELPVSLYLHGVDAQFTPSPIRRQRLAEEYRQGDFRIIHLSSSLGERKGTHPLRVAFALASSRGKIPKSATLDLYMDGMYSDNTGPMRYHSRPNFTVEASATLYSHSHLVCQPSRAEGFGLIPLEAMACGSVVAMTHDTGHLAYAASGNSVKVKTGGYSRIDDGPGATAPTVDVESVHDAIVDAYENWQQWHDAALVVVPDIRSRWSWESVTRQWLDEVSK